MPETAYEAARGLVRLAAETKGVDASTTNELLTLFEIEARSSEDGGLHYVDEAGKVAVDRLTGAPLDVAGWLRSVEQRRPRLLTKPAVSAPVSDAAPARPMSAAENQMRQFAPMHHVGPDATVTELMIAAGRGDGAALSQLTAKAKEQARAQAVAPTSSRTTDINFTDVMARSKGNPAAIKAVLAQIGGRR